MRRQRKAKIVATLGPASSDQETIRALFEAGVDVFRFNFSHGTQEEHRARYEIVREVERQVGRPIGILADLQGPKLRVGRFAAQEVELVRGKAFTFDRNPEAGDETRVFLPHPELFNLMSEGHAISLNDGRVRLRVIESDADRIKTEVIIGGPVSDRKGVNVPDVVLPIPILTEKDRKDLEFALSLGVDWVALSFVQRPEDLGEARRLINGRAGLMTKLEKPSALEQLDEIVSASDAVMVARGDLGVELPPEQVPGAQKRILRACRHYGKPSIVATQMLESMVFSPTPTRAEASDVASAIYDGTDAVMLSAESASGAYPVQAVSMMDRIINEVERDPIYPKMVNAQHEMLLPSPRDAIFVALRAVTHIIRAVATVTYTDSGSTSLWAARERPMAPILSITPHLETARRLALAWGVHSMVIDRDVENVHEMVDIACRMAFTEGFGLAGDQIAIAAGMPFGETGNTNLLRVAEIPASYRK